jgi:peroxiredoxin
MRTILLYLLCAAVLCGAGELSNRRAPGFSLPDSRGARHDLQNYKGKVVIVEFMQTICPHCIEFAAVLESVRAKYGDRVAVLSVVNPPDNAQTVANYVKEHKITAPVLLDRGQVAFSYLKTPSFDIPHLFLIDAAGTIRNDFGFGPANKQIFEGKALFAEIDRLLKEMPPAPKR